MDKSVEEVENLGLLERLAKTGLPLVGIFAKEPRPGEVKTRLIPPLTPAGAMRLYETSLAETVRAFSDPVLPFRTVLFYAGDAEWFCRTFPDFPLVPQGRGGLGMRMSRALERLLKAGAPAAALVGSDSPDLPTALVARALAALREAEAVSVPSADGGYVLVGLSAHRPELFREVPWSTPGVLEATRARAAAHAIDYREIGAWEDVDDLPSLRRLLTRSPRCATARLGRILLEQADHPPVSSEAAGPSAG